MTTFFYNYQLDVGFSVVFVDSCKAFSFSVPSYRRCERIPAFSCAYSNFVTEY